LLANAEAETVPLLSVQYYYRLMALAFHSYWCDNKSMWGVHAQVNQARASALLHQLAHDRGSACQIMCVTHNYGFQERCDGFVRVTKSASGHSVPAEQGANTGAAVAGPGRPQQKKASRSGGKQTAGQRAAGKMRGEPVGAEGPLSKKGGGGRAKRVRFATSS
jgi:hypothetical protein